MSALLLGAMLGAGLSGYLADAISRKWTKVLSGSVSVVGALGCAFAVNAPMLIGFRFLLGISVGAASFVAPLYISEVSPPKVRGGLVSFNQLAVTTGILTAYDVDQELRDIAEASAKEKDSSVRDLVTARIRPLLIIGLGLALFQQFVGINTVIYYAPTILADTGLTNSSSITQTVFVGVTNVVFTAIAVLLLDRVGRRKLLLTGTCGLIVALALLGVYFSSPTLQQHAGYLALIALLLYIASFAIGLGPVFWLMISEIYPIGVRSPAMSVSTIANWGANFLVAATFLSLGSLITRQGTFFLYGGIGVLALLFFWSNVPETKDRTLEEIQDDFTDTTGGSDSSRGEPRDASPTGRQGAASHRASARASVDSPQDDGGSR